MADIVRPVEISHPAAPRLAGVVGWPVSHSLSPVIHRIWATREGAPAYYAPIAVPPNDHSFRRILDGLKAAGYAGVNVTIPHKERALSYADDAAPVAHRVGAANMLTFARGGGAFADNSDVAGFAHALAPALTGEPAGLSVLVLGAGGAARAVIAALTDLRPAIGDILIANRTRTRADALARDFEDASLTIVDWDDRQQAADRAGIVVNTTSLGMAGKGDLGVVVGDRSQARIVADIVYAPLETPLLASAAAAGVKTVDGLAMLMHQAAPGYRAWLGEEAQVDEDLRAALIAEIDRRRNAPC